MIDFLWWMHSDVPFWEKMYAITLIGGVTFFIVELFDMLKGWNIKLRTFAHDCYQTYRKDIGITKELINDWRGKHDN